MPQKKDCGSEPLAFPCTSCTRPFASAIALKDHNRDKHAIRTNPSKITATSKTPNAAWKNVEFVAPVIVKGTSTTWDAFTLHFGSSLQLSTPPQIAVKTPTKTPPTYKYDKYAKLGRYRAIEASIARKQAGTQPNAQAPTTQPQRKQLIIAKSQHPTPLTKLTSLCHTRATLIANKYTLDANNINFIKDAGALMLISLPTPLHNHRSPKRDAIVLNCETIYTGNRDTGTIHICAIDYFTSKILIDALIQPIAHLRIEYTQMSQEATTPTVTTSTILRSWPEARAELWKHMDANTILVGHALRYPLNALRMQHSRIVDTSVLVLEILGPRVKWSWSVKVLCDQLLNVQIQDHSQTKCGSIALTLAVRDLVERWMSHPFEVSLWATRQQKEWLGMRKRGLNKVPAGPPDPNCWSWSVLALTERNPFSPD